MNYFVLLSMVQAVAAHPDSLFWTETLISPAVSWVPPGNRSGGCCAQWCAPSQGSMPSVTCCYNTWVPSLIKNTSKGLLSTRVLCRMGPGFCYNCCPVQFLQPSDLLTHTLGLFFPKLPIKLILSQSQRLLTSKINPRHTCSKSRNRGSEEMLDQDHTGSIMHQINTPIFHSL